MLLQWRAVGVDVRSEWQHKRELAIQDAASYLEGGDEAVVRVRVAFGSWRARRATREARARAVAVFVSANPQRPPLVLVGGEDMRRDVRHA